MWGGIFPTNNYHIGEQFYPYFDVVIHNLDGAHVLLVSCRPSKTSCWLINPETKELINPYDLVTDENIIMTDWEIQDFAVQVVRNYIKDKNKYFKLILLFH